MRSSSQKRERVTADSWAGSAAPADAVLQTDRPIMSKPRINELSRQKIQELPIEFARYSNTFTTFKHLDKNRVALCFSHAPKRTLQFQGYNNRRPQTSYIIH